MFALSTSERPPPGAPLGSPLRRAAKWQRAEQLAVHADSWSGRRRGDDFRWDNHRVRSRHEPSATWFDPIRPFGAPLIAVRYTSRAVLETR